MQSYDYLPQPKDNDHLHPVKLFFGPEFVGEFMTHPYASPLFGDFKGLPPMLIQNGDAERLRDEGTLLAHKASQAGVIVEHEVYEDCVHVFQVSCSLFAKVLWSGLTGSLLPRCLASWTLLASRCARYVASLNIGAAKRPWKRPASTRRLCLTLTASAKAMLH